jgi:hypothetical protein
VKRSHIESHHRKNVLTEKRGGGCFCVMGLIAKIYNCHVFVWMAMYMKLAYTDSLEPYTNDTVLMPDFLIFPSETTQLHHIKMECSSMLRYSATSAYCLYHVQLKNYRPSSCDVLNSSIDFRNDCKYVPKYTAS